MAALAIPDILNHIAVSGKQGLPLTSEPRLRRELELCRRWGFPLEIRGNRVYLPFDDGMLVPIWIQDETPSISWEKLRVAGFFEIGSTNDQALMYARRGEPAGTLIFAETQTAGRGRKGRHWSSPPGGGLYFSLVLRPAQALNRWPLLTHVASVALVETLNDLTGAGLKVDLKWPNDVLLSGKKTAGILLETVRGLESRSHTAAVLGVGINVAPHCVPEDLRDQATSINAEAEVPIARRRLLVRFLYFFQLGYCLFERGKHGKILEQWKVYSSMWDGVPVQVIEGDRCRFAVTSGISDLGALKVRTPDGKEETLLTADVTVRRSSP